MGRKRQVDEAPFSSAPVTPRTITSADIQQKEFAVSRLGGYRMRDVDEFLDHVAASIAALIAENDRLRNQSGAGPVLGSPDLADVSRQADEIIQRAREEAANILAGASGAAGTAVAPTAAERAAVSAFLTQERGFLQSLAELVQDHAESIKGMAKQARRTPTPTAAAKAPSPSPASPPPPPLDPAVTQPIATVEEPIRVDEPTAATAKPKAGDAEGDGSLRDLFWGEES